MTRHPFAPLYAVLIAAALAAGIWGWATLLTTPPPHTSPDMTYADCTLWDNGHTPVLPANTYTDRCYDAAHQTIAYSDPTDAH